MSGLQPIAAKRLVFTGCCGWTRVEWGSWRRIGVFSVASRKHGGYCAWTCWKHRAGAFVAEYPPLRRPSRLCAALRPLRGAQRTRGLDRRLRCGWLLVM